MCHNFNTMPKLTTHAEVQLGPQGRVVIPALLRRQLGFEPGDKLIVRLEDDRLILEKPETIKHRLKARFAHVPKGRSLADELISERRGSQTGNG